ncbi:ribosomal RNA small subunit methyltransferase A [Rhodococcus sp. 06-235-1A]|uniref:ribosomal RNA small subunit methyltransferase A n=1 Tax=Rhodococcus sp. 06-235-1A TaxID=2022508 RepID=UPI00117AB3E9|nr:rRNA adenine N(6)-methyltransferase family protein [Rhodococcus sp. 06-235-1A]
MSNPRGSLPPPSAQWARTAPAVERRKALGQNFFRSPTDACRFVRQVQEDSTATVVEIGAGSGMITSALSAAGRSVEAVEIDPEWAKRLAERELVGVRVHTADFLDWQMPLGALLFVGNIPFGSSTSIVRHCLQVGPTRLRGMVLLTQREFAEKRCGRWGGNLFNAQWAPWFSFSLGEQFSRRKFKPAPATDTATLFVDPLSGPMLPWADRVIYQETVRALFSTGHAQVREACAAVSRTNSWPGRAGVSEHTRVKDLSTSDWVALHLSKSIQHIGESRRGVRVRRQSPARRKKH